MIWEVWAIPTSNLIAAEESEAEALAVVRDDPSHQRASRRDGILRRGKRTVRVPVRLQAAQFKQSRPRRGRQRQFGERCHNRRIFAMPPHGRHGSPSPLPT